MLLKKNNSITDTIIADYLLSHFRLDLLKDFAKVRSPSLIMLSNIYVELFKILATPAQIEQAIAISHRFYFLGLSFSVMLQSSEVVPGNTYNYNTIRALVHNQSKGIQTGTDLIIASVLKGDYQKLQTLPTNPFTDLLYLSLSYKDDVLSFTILFKNIERSLTGQITKRVNQCIYLISILKYCNYDSKIFNYIMNHLQDYLNEAFTPELEKYAGILSLFFSKLYMDFAGLVEIYQKLDSDGKKSFWDYLLRVSSKKPSPENLLDFIQTFKPKIDHQ